MENIVRTKSGKISFYLRSKKDKTMPTIVFFQAFGGDSCYYNFKNIIEKIPEKYGILTFDYLGYGLSDITTSPRTINNIRNEIHTVIGDLIAGDIVFFSHSIGGFYALDYYLSYPKRIVGFIGIEPTTFQIIYDNPDEFDGYINAAKEFNALTRSQQDSEKDNADGKAIQNPFLDFEDAKSNLKILMSKVYNQNLMCEARSTTENIQAIKDKQFSDSIPVLLFAQPTRAKRLMKSQYINRNSMTKTVVIPGSHYLHWTQPQTIVSETIVFLNHLSIKA